MAIERLPRDVLARLVEVLSPSPPLLDWQSPQREIESSHPTALINSNGRTINLSKAVQSYCTVRGLRVSDMAIAFRRLLEPRVPRAAAVRHAFCSDAAAARRHSVDNSILDDPELRLVVTWRALFPSRRADQARLIGAASIINHHRRGAPGRLLVNPEQLRRRYHASAEPLGTGPELDLVLSSYTQFNRERARVGGSVMFEAASRAATVPFGPQHASRSRPPLDDVEKEHPIQFAWREEFVPTASLWELGDVNLAPESTGIPACPKCAAWLFDGETCVACMDGKITGLFESRPAGEATGRFELEPLSRIHDGPCVKADDRPFRVEVDSDDESEVRRPLTGVVPDRTTR